MDRRQLFSLAPLAGGLLALAAAASPAKASGGGGSTAAKSGYVRLGTVTASVIRHDGRRGVMTVETGIDCPDAELSAQVALEGPRLRAAYNTVCQDAASRLLPGGIPDVDGLRHALQVATIRTLKKRGAVVLLGTVMVV